MHYWIYLALIGKLKFWIVLMKLFGELWWWNLQQVWYALLNSFCNSILQFWIVPMKVIGLSCPMEFIWFLVPKLQFWYLLSNPFIRIVLEFQAFVLVGAPISGQWNWTRSPGHSPSCCTRTGCSWLFCTWVFCLGCTYWEFGTSWVRGEEYVHGCLWLEALFSEYRGIMDLPQDFLIVIEALYPQNVHWLLSLISGVAASLFSSFYWELQPLFLKHAWNVCLHICP